MNDYSKLFKNISLTPLEISILDYMTSNMEETKKNGIRGVASKNYTSTTTIIRLAKKLGYQGFTDMYYGLSSKLDKSPTEQQAVPFISQYISHLQNIQKDYASVKKLAELLREKKKQMIYICGMGFSRYPAEYFAKKLMVQGIKCIFSGAEESVGIFENNLDDIGLFIAVSRSGETMKVLERVQKASAQNFPIASFTSNRSSSLGEASDIVITMEDDCSFDDRNEYPCYFFTGIMLQMELVLLELSLLF